MTERHRDSEPRGFSTDNDRVRLECHHSVTRWTQHPRGGKDSLGSVTIGVIAGSELVWTRSYGFADMKSRRVADRNTVYRIGSITKPFTPVMLMQLSNAGKIRLSDPVEKYFPEIKQVGGMSPGAPPVTFLQLATMTAGLAREPREEGPFWREPVSNWEQTLISALPHASYETFPGTRFSYSNIGCAIPGAALGRVAGESYVNWERTRVLEPLGMKRTRFEIDANIAADVAHGYVVTRDGSLDGDTPAIAQFDRDQRRLFDAFAECFNRRDWEGLKHLVRADARLEIVGENQGVMSVLGATYSGNYTRLPHEWRLSAEIVDGMPALIHWRRAATTWEPYSAIRLWWEGGQVVRIRDYIHVGYLLSGSGIPR